MWSHVPTRSASPGWSQVPTRSSPTRPVSGGYSQVRPGPYRAGGYARAPRPSPQWRPVNGANQYARQRLALAARQGYTPAQFGIKGNAAAQWRAISPIIGALASIRAGHASDYRWNPGGGQVNSGVAALVQQLLQEATGPIQGLGSV